MLEAAVNIGQLPVKETEQIQPQKNLRDTTMYKAGHMLGSVYAVIKHETRKAYYLHLTPENVNKARAAIALGMTTMAIAGGVINTINHNPEVFHRIGNSLHEATDKVGHFLGFDGGHGNEPGGGGHFQVTPGNGEVDQAANEQFCQANPDAYILPVGQDTTVEAMLSERFGITIDQISTVDIETFKRLNTPEANPTIYMDNNAYTTELGGCYILPSVHTPDSVGMPEIKFPDILPEISIDNEKAQGVIAIFKELWNNQPGFKALTIGGSLAVLAVAMTIGVPKYSHWKHKRSIGIAMGMINRYAWQGSIPHDEQRRLMGLLQDYERKYGFMPINAQTAHQYMPNLVMNPRMQQANRQTHRAGRPVRHSAQRHRRTTQPVRRESWRDRRAERRGDSGVSIVSRPDEQGGERQWIDITHTQESRGPQEGDVDPSGKYVFEDGEWMPIHSPPPEQWIQLDDGSWVRMEDDQEEDSGFDMDY